MPHTYRPRNEKVVGCRIRKLLGESHVSFFSLNPETLLLSVGSRLRHNSPHMARGDGCDGQRRGIGRQRQAPAGPGRAGCP